MGELGWCLAALTMLSSTALAGTDDDGFGTKSREQAEARVLATLAPLARRKGDHLVLRARHGKPATFDNVHPDFGEGEASYRDFRLIGVSPDKKFFIVEATFYEGGNVFWVSRGDGKKYAVEAAAKMSQDHQHVVTVNASDAYDINGVVLWAIRNDALVERFRFEPAGIVYYGFVRWLSPTSALLKKRYVADKTLCPTSSFMEHPVTLRRTAGTWALDERFDRQSLRCHDDLRPAAQMD